MTKVQSPRRIWIDADGCPVVKETIALAKEYRLPVTLVKNHSIQLESDYATIVTVEVSRDAADFYILTRMHPEDIVVTQDNGLCAMVISKKGHCIDQNGKIITEDQIHFLLQSRHVSRKERMQNLKGPKIKKREDRDNLLFTTALKKLLTETTPGSS
ncbi:YaiI/YqxD family protein [Isachenkonia alkalipeptolytica]|uniref:YaiI/YqxD family protein n=1 Tax=Isachenkonia alkalipeptolytica TaxID=2565777 RepID=A0AA43XIH4_9CLOT|nr:DUF188 domain-containing protein [Isachenkonia alkalipeptolytica]NBG86916.1 YaiI/YqxD family protein [Isachenkonia alkalipeptolytica]